MRIFKIVPLLIVFACLALASQTAHVVALDADDAAASAQLYKAKVDADKAWEDQHDAIGKKYLQATGGPHGFRPRTGFENGFEFSKDFKVVVPVPSQSYGYIASAGGAWISSSCCGTVTQTYCGR